ncbi:polysaccharide biosynthesis/export family protein [Thermodesulforhabdus norvegica]|uniref:Polysaccharide export outer membrane protein n=1 Tax=Thermodesulforhabdus norvegica TaxID=39841 RepID=A0A1I4WC61_9BACT|nr:polysaccharide biosynthesis/export family protein [Thermodesulforhabdus norvegica]SFN10997.1 polysaccharide export outer membrane protein [Thermodesulforhabdus norvegica]
MKKVVKLLTIFLITCTSISILSGCSVSRPYEKSIGGDITYLDERSEKVKDEHRRQLVSSLLTGLKTYRLLPGDVLEVMYIINPVQEEDGYRLKVGDKIRVDFFYHSQFSRDYTIRPDGMITLPVKGEVYAINQKPSELAEKIARLYSDMLRDPVVNVQVLEYRSKAELARMSLDHPTKGWERTIVIAPDGTIQLPFVGQVKAAGRTVDDLEKFTNRLFAEKAPGVNIHCRISEIRGTRIFVFGAVRNPGIIIPEGPITITQALATAGGITSEGDINRVGVLYWTEDGETRTRTISVKRVMDRLTVEDDIILPPLSVVYVPLTPVAKIGRFMEQYVKNVFMFTGAGLGFSYEIHSEGSD